MGIKWTMEGSKGRWPGLAGPSPAGQPCKVRHEEPAQRAGLPAGLVRFGGGFSGDSMTRPAPACGEGVGREQTLGWRPGTLLQGTGATCVSYCCVTDDP